ncbi:hypothetical protein Daus18300_003550 [Diaporthe australafricana]|uniref:MARVEL domain-containing protein n=1 Tax=Diaporthe australafricana TaxID=127596 RepID=A0ABR3XF27_9PEZI
MLSAITLGLRVLQIILSIALLGLSVNLARFKTCTEFLFLCITWPSSIVVTLRYSIFLGIYGIVTAALGIGALYLDRIPLIAQLAADAFAALFFLAGGIGWVVNFVRLEDYGSLFDAAFGQARGAQGLVWTLFAVTACIAVCTFLRRRDQAQSSK